MDDEDYHDLEDLSDPHMEYQGGGDGDEAGEILEVDTDDSTTRTSGKKLRWGRPEGADLATTPSSTPDDL